MASRGGGDRAGSSAAAEEYHLLPDRSDRDAIDDAASDDSRLKQLGYKQELRRGLTAIANFSVTFSIVSVLTGLTTMYGTGLTYGGPLTMIYGWPFVGMMTLLVGFSMAEICSAFPTSGGLYFWSAKLCGTEWGPLASWFTGCHAFQGRKNGQPEVQGKFWSSSARGQRKTELNLDLDRTGFPFNKPEKRERERSSRARIHPGLNTDL
ncbi:hypothetical protein BT93_B2530 [Corymbia citriodora subsp. variegata]|nr:hypothetical protein BT93_B2530 [Corymbia citriodora subsp. variegata]